MVPFLAPFGALRLALGRQTVPDGADAPVSTFGGNFALTGRDTSGNNFAIEAQIDFSDTDTYALENFGVECANADCVKGNSNQIFSHLMQPTKTLMWGFQSERTRALSIVAME